ncbi:MAG TPA: hypothetical protein VF683_06190 [Chthoniobacterales bacterium]
MIARSLQFISVGAFLAIGTAIPAAADLQPGSVARVTFRDVDGNDLSTAAGYVTIIAVASRENADKAKAVADRVPDRYIGDQRYRYVTVVNFQGKVPRPLYGLTRSIIRQRLEAEAKRFRASYQAKKIGRDPRRDLFVVADFDGTAVRQLGLTPESTDVKVFVFNREGKLVERWANVPPGDSLAKAIDAAE